MATIALYAGQINQMSGLIGNIKGKVMDFQSELSALRTNSQQVNQSICNLSGVVSSIQASSQTQDQKLASLDALNRNLEQFAESASRVDGEVADTVRQRKDDFYEKYNYLKPECEKNGWEKFCDGCAKVGEWCKEHWKEILITVVIVIGAALAIAAVICSGGLALVPMLAAGLTALGVSAGTAMTVATVISLTVAGIAIASTIVSSTLNIVDTWYDMSNNSTFKSWQTAMNWISAISNGFYSVGELYNSVHGITNESLRELAKILKGDNTYLTQIATSPNTSAFWSGLGRGGQDIAADAAKNAGKETLEMTLERAGVDMPQFDRQVASSIEAWGNASSAFAWNSSGNVTAFLGKNVASDSIWRTLEYPLLQINPYVKSIVNGSGSLLRYFSLSSFYSGLRSAAESIVNAVLNQ